MMFAWSRPMPDESSLSAPLRSTMTLFGEPVETTAAWKPLGQREREHQDRDHHADPERGRERRPRAADRRCGRFSRAGSP
jgi:hypothetical protein